MYDFFFEAHRGLSVLSLLFTLGWGGIVFSAQPGTAALGGLQRLVYIGALAFTGLLGLSGLAVIGPWFTMLFPWLGLFAIVGHGIAGARSRKALAAGDKQKALLLVALQTILIIVALLLMVFKTF